jgi:hypothetical protein
MRVTPKFDPCPEGSACTLNHATGVCTSGVCKIQSCDAGWNDCYGGDANGCECSGLCNAAHCVETLASVRSDPYGLFVSGDTVYWSEAIGAGGIFYTQVGSGVVKQLASAGPTYVIAGDATNVYWMNPNTNKLEQTTRASGATIDLASVTGALAGQSELGTTDGAYVYYYDGAGAVAKVPVGGGAVVKLATGQAGVGPVRVDANNVYWSSGGVVQSVAKDPAVSTTITTYATITGDNASVTGFVVDATSIYWAEPNNNRVMKASLGTPHSPTQLASYHAAGLWVDGSTLYVTDYSNPAGKISTLSTSGGATTDIATSQHNPDVVVTDGTSVYWTEYATPGKVMRVTPK